MSIGRFDSIPVRLREKARRFCQAPEYFPTSLPGMNQVRHQARQQILRLRHVMRCRNAMAVNLLAGEVSVHETCPWVSSGVTACSSGPKSYCGLLFRSRGLLLTPG